MRRGLLATPEELHALADRIGEAPYDQLCQRLQSRCELILQSTPATEMNWQSAWANGRWNAALAAARGLQGRILDLVIADAIDRNSAYRSRAAEELTHLARWSTWADPSRPNMPLNLCTAEAAVAAVIGLDWMWDDLNVADRTRLLDNLHERVIKLYHNLVTTSPPVWWYSAVNHWNAVMNGACGLVGLALGDTNDQAAEVLDLSREGLEHFFDDLGRDGGWDEGTGYWGYAVRSVLLLGEACSRVLDEQSIIHHRGMEATGLFPIYFTPNGHPASFGDQPTLPTHGTLYLLDRYFDRRELTWWLDTYADRHDVSTFGWSQAGVAMLARPQNGTIDPPELQPVKIFNQIGWAAMADQWPRPTFYAAVKTGDLAVSHSQRDMNSIQVQVDGEMLLVDVGHPPGEASEYFSASRADFYEVQASAHNTITVAEEDHRPDAIGFIRDGDEGSDFRWVTADSQDACGEGVTFVRHVVMLLDGKGRGESLVVLDELDLPAPERVDVFWHTAGKIHLDGQAGRIVGRRAGLHVQMACTVPAEVATFSQPMEHDRADHVLHLSAGMIGRQVVASVFSRKEIAKLGIEQAERGDVTLTVGKRKVTFATRRGQRYLTPEM
ncbi:MAG: hypothetical protein GVY16_01240 [Planctomycetes bacterium]|nr:hypothetical protein [Planctomycetota bacterium]